MSDTCDDTSRTATPEAPASRRTRNEYYLSDYVGIQVDPSGRLFKSFTCPHLDTMCDGCTLLSVAECLQHERDHHMAPYTCLICGQRFAVATSLRRHAHYNGSEEKREAIRTADAIKQSVASVRGDGSTVSSVRVYHGNVEARKRATRLLELVKEEEFEEGSRRKNDRRAAAKRSSKRVSTRDSVVVGAVDETEDADMAGTVLNDEMPEAEAWSCCETCCPFFERHFPSKGAYTQHLSSQAHQVSARMGEALLDQLKTILNYSQTSHTDTKVVSNCYNEAEAYSARVKQSSPSSTDVEMSDYIADLGITRANTPPPHAHTNFPSPPATPSTDTAPQPQPQLLQSPSSTEDALPKGLAERLAATRVVLRELQCNAPGCTMYRKKMASSPAYWSHLASSPHMTALREWNAAGGDAVFVRV